MRTFSDADRNTLIKVTNGMMNSRVASGYEEFVTEEGDPVFAMLCADGEAFLLVTKESDERYVFVNRIGELIGIHPTIEAFLEGMQPTEVLHVAV